MVGVKDSHGVEPDTSERPQERLRVLVPDREGNGGNAARLPDRRHDFDRGPLLRSDVPGMLAGEKTLEGVVVGDGMARPDERARQMRPPPHPAPDVPPDRVEVA